MKVLYRQDHRCRQAEPLDQRQHGLQDPKPERRRLDERQRAPDRVAVPDEQVANLRSLRVRCCRVKVQRLDQCPEGPVSLQLRRCSDAGLEAQSSRAVQDFDHKPRLPNPRLALDEADLAGPFGGPAEQRLQGGQLCGAPYKRHSSRRRSHHPRKFLVGVSRGAQPRRMRSFMTASPGADCIGPRSVDTGITGTAERTESTC